MSKTINQLISVLEDFKNRHLMINDVGDGDISEINTSEHLYPLLWIFIQDASLIKSDMGYKTIDIKFQLLVMDLVHKDDSNEDEVLSDTFKTLNDIITELDGNIYFVNNRISIVNDIVLIPFSERFDDDVSGWRAEITLRMPNTWTYCKAPVTVAS